MNKRRKFFQLGLLVAALGFIGILWYINQRVSRPTADVLFSAIPPPIVNLRAINFGTPEQPGQYAILIGVYCAEEISPCDHSFRIKYQRSYPDADDPEPEITLGEIQGGGLGNEVVDEFAPELIESLAYQDGGYFLHQLGTRDEDPTILDSLHNYSVVLFDPLTGGESTPTRVSYRIPSESVNP